MKDEITLKVEAVLETIRPFLHADGGDVELVEVNPPEVKLRLTGACKSCSMSQMTMKAGLEEGIKKAVPEILNVTAVNE